jgi:hypothetical protein
MFGIIYKAVHRETGKTYVGQTRQTTDERMARHLHMGKYKYRNSYFDAALYKHGLGAFEISEIDTASNQSELDCKESAWIIKLHSLTPDGKKQSAQTLRKKSKSLRKYWKEKKVQQAIEAPLRQAWASKTLDKIFGKAA